MIFLTMKQKVSRIKHYSHTCFDHSKSASVAGTDSNARHYISFTNEILSDEILLYCTFHKNTLKRIILDHFSCFIFENEGEMWESSAAHIPDHDPQIF
jgi:hypothetical protein